jgi:hypothetical protein
MMVLTAVPVWTSFATPPHFWSSEKATFTHPAPLVQLAPPDAVNSQLLSVSSGLATQQLSSTAHVPCSADGNGDGLGDGNTMVSGGGSGGGGDGGSHWTAWDLHLSELSQ